MNQSTLHGGLDKAFWVSRIPGVPPPLFVRNSKWPFPPHLFFAFCVSELVGIPPPREQTPNPRKSQPRLDYFQFWIQRHCKGSFGKRMTISCSQCPLKVAIARSLKHQTWHTVYPEKEEKKNVSFEEICYHVRAFQHISASRRSTSTDHVCALPVAPALLLFTMCSVRQISSV